MADLDRAACLPTSVHPLWDNQIVFEIKHLADIRPRFRSDTHHIEKRPVVAVVYPAFHHIFQKEIPMGCAVKPYIRHRLHLPKLGRHQLIQLRIAWELVDKRYKGAANFEKPLTCPHIRDITHLQIGDVKELGKLDTVCGRLIEHDDKLGVGKHCPRRVALQEVVHILGNTCAVRPVFPNSLPEGKEEVGGILMLKQQVNLVNENECVPAFCPGIIITLFLLPLFT